MKSRLSPAIRRTVALAAFVTACAPVLLNAQEQERSSQHHGRRTFFTLLNGVSEAPSVSSTGRGSFLLVIDRNDDEMQFTLGYSRLEGATVTQAHVHFGQPNTVGGVSFFLCGGGGKPPCPLGPVTITGTVVPADVLGPANQGIAAGEFGEILAAIRNGDAYVNVHTDKHPGGEIRGHLR